MDNDSRLVEELPSNYPGTIFLLWETESPRNDIDVVPCKDFKTLELKIVERLIG